MKMTKNLLMAGMVVAFCCSIGNAQIIYSNAFNGGAVDINNQAPTYVNPNAPLFGGSSSALWDVVTNNSTFGYYANQDGTLGAGSESVLLPFTPVSGYVYTLTASLTFAVQPPSGGWGALGYGAHFPPSNGSTADPRFNSTLVNGNPWALLNYASQGGGAVLFQSRTGTAGSMANLMSSLNTPYTISFVLDTTAPQWSTALYIDSTQVASYNYTANPSIASIGYGQTATTAGAYQWNYLTLSAEPVPEPSTLALVGLIAGLMLLVTLRGNRRYAVEKTIRQRDPA